MTDFNAQQLWRAAYRQDSSGRALAWTSSAGSVAVFIYALVTDITTTTGNLDRLSIIFLIVAGTGIVISVLGVFAYERAVKTSRGVQREQLRLQADAARSRDSELDAEIMAARMQLEKAISFDRDRGGRSLL